jgi:hypothetical protein
MQKAFPQSSRIALAVALVVGIGCGVGCGGSSSSNPDAKDGPKDQTAGSAGTSGSGGTTGAGGGDGGAGSTGAGGTTNATGGGGTTGGAGTGAAGTGAAGTGAAGTGAAGGDGGAGTGAAGTGAAGSDGGAGTGAAGGDGGAGTGAAGSDGGAGTGAAGNDGGVSDGGGDAAVCTAGAKRCASGGVETCVADTNGVTSWGAAVACGAHSTCSTTGGTAACACNATACTVAGDFCSSGNAKTTCQVDVEGCLYVAAGPTACGTHQSCTGAAGAATCSCNTDPNCTTGTATFCASGSTKSTCATDGDGCFYVASTVACAAHQSCTGANPNGTCTCDPSPPDCAGGAGTFCATSGSVSTCAVDTNNCVYVTGTANCGSHQTCSGGAGVGACGCNAPPAGCTAVGNYCDNGNSSACAQDAQGCFYVSGTTTCGARQTCNGSGVCECNAGPAGCTAAGKFCDGSGNLTTCAADANGCFFVNGAPQACGAAQTCTGSLPGAACTCNPAPAVCAGGAAGTYCFSGTETATCAPDAQGCVVVSSTHVCGPRQTCSGTSGSNSCVCNTPPAGCTANGTFCPDSGHVSTCAADSDGCFDVSATTACPMNQSCKGAGIGNTCTCDNTCTAGQVGTYCIDTLHSATCADDVNGCHLTSNTVTCVGTQTCQGAGGGGSCQCQPLGTTAGTSCQTLGATICQGNTVLTCTADVLGGCQVWAAPVDCTGQSLVCGTKSGVAACQCAEHTGTDYYVDNAAGSDAAAGVFPTGNLNPANCSFKTLGRALTAATTAGNKVIAKNQGTYDGETFPLTVSPGVELTTADGASLPAQYVIEFKGAATPGVSLGAGSVIEGFTIANNNGAAAATAIQVTGAGAVVDSVVLDGTGGTTLAKGIDITGSGYAQLAGVTVSGFTTGIAQSTTAGVATTLSSSQVTGNGTGVALANGTLTTSGSTIGIGTTGVAISAAAGALTTFNGSSLTVLNDTGVGISVSATGGAPTLNLTSADIHHNNGGGISVAGAASTANVGAIQLHDNPVAGLSMSAGTVTFTGTSVTGNAVGILQSGGTLTVGTTNVKGNTGIGLNASAGTVALNTGANFEANGGDGVFAKTNVTVGGSASAPITSNSNGGDGFSLAAGTLTANYLTLSTNGTGAVKASGLKVSGTGVVNLGVATDSALNFSNNGLHGINIAATTAGSAVSVMRTTVGTNGGDGIAVDLNGGTASPGATATIINVTSSGNTGSGIGVTRAPLVNSGLALTLDGLTLSGNGVSGLYLKTTGGNVGAVLKNSKVSGNTGFGVRIENGGGANTVTESLQYNDITGNTGGGIAFNQQHTLTSFAGNSVHGNTGDQILIAARQVGNANYKFNNVSAVPCDSNRNQFYCYKNGGVGIRITSAATVVDANNVSWQVASPGNTTDFVQSTSTVNFAPTCTPVTTCP